MARVGVVLGGGIEQSGELPPYVLRRIDTVTNHSPGLDHIVFSSRYTLNKPQVLDADGFVITEAAAMAQHFSKRNAFSSSEVYLELASTDTIGSALHTRSLLENIGITNGELFIFTNDWHHERSEFIFKWAFALKSRFHDFDLDVLGVPAVDPSPPYTRIIKESLSLNSFKKEWETINCLPEAWRKLYHEHDNYNLKNNSLKVVDAEMRY